MSAGLQHGSERLTSWLRREALPLWATRGIDTRTHACHERLLADGTPDRTANHRVLVQARQAFVYALAHHLGWYPDGPTVAGGIFDFVERVCVHPGNRCGYVHLLDHRFEVIDHQQRLYDQAFFLLAHAWCYRAFGLPSSLARATALAAHLNDTFATGNGGWRDSHPPGGYRRQNPHMHLLEAFLALYDATAHGCWLEGAGAVFRLFESRFFDPSHGVVLEHFHDDWRPLSTRQGQTVEPGHMMEWVWLLWNYGQRTGTSVSSLADTLYDRALEIGRCTESGLLFDAVTPDGHIIAATKRCWPMTEYVKASIAQAYAGRAGAEERAAEAIEQLFEAYLCAATPGSWIDQRGPTGEIVVDAAPASTLYHLTVAAAEASRWCDRP